MSLPAQSASMPLLMDPDAFEHMQRVGGMLALSPLFPEHLRKGSKETAIANGVLVMNMASRLNEDPLTVAQNIYFVGGKPGWSSSYMIGKANQHGVFKNPISWDLKGSGDNLSVTAFAELASTGKKVTATCDMAMAKAESWTKNPKYRSMPEQMLRYRSATFLIRLYCPEVMVGVPAQVEVELDMKDVTPADALDKYQTRQPAEPVAEAEVVPETEEEQQETAAETAPDPEQFQKLVDMIANDLIDSSDLEGVLELYQDQIEKMEAAAPEAHMRLLETVAEFRKTDN